MAVGFDHPVVADYLRRLEAAAVSLPPGRREELVAEIRGHVAEALEAAGRDDEAAVRQVLDRLGEPADIVAAEAEAVAAPDAPAWQGGWQNQPPVVLPPRSPWGAVEIFAVLGLTIGCFVIPVVGPIIGLVCAWVSERWTRREKVIATIWTVVGPVLLVLGALGVLIGARVDADSSHAVVDAPAPVVVDSAPAPDASIFPSLIPSP